MRDPTRNLAEALSREVFPRVEKPSRYLGTEVNATRKDLAAVEARIVLCFPDLYDLGLGNLGLHILYSILNKLPWCWAERAYAPAKDMEQQLRALGMPLFANESKDPLGCFDGVGFTLQSELTYTNILGMIALGGIPLRSEDRTDAHPLVFAGGPAVFNPEPLAPFMDFLVVGDGEDVVVEIAEVLRAHRDRASRLDALERIPGVYVPSRYPTETLPDGTVVPAAGAPKIVKRTVSKLRGDQFPVDYVVPFTEQVHDRVSLEVLRGCTQGCRFCQAGMTTRPVRERTVEDVDRLVERTIAATGYEEVSLVSLSTCDHSQVRKLVETVVARARPDHVTVTLPSLRLDSFSVELADMVGETRRTGLTFAPEAASPRLRAVINKWIPDEELIGMATEAYRRGWDHVKLYFMIGLPTERDDDLHAIADLCARVVAEGKRIHPKAGVHTGVSTFVPKPFTPFQWAAQIDLDETVRKQELLHGRLRSGKGVKFGRHDPRETFLEGLLSRGDRRTADLLEAAFRRGARFDAWREHLDWEAWQGAIAEVGFDVAHAIRERDLDERLPWDHLDIHIPKAWFQEDWRRAVQLQHAPDCRHSKCHRCGVIDAQRPLCAHMLRNAIEGRKQEATWARAAAPRPPDPPPVQRVRLRVGRTGDTRFLGHLEFMHAWMRALRRAGVGLSWSQGFHPHPRMQFSGALPLGEESLGEYLDVTLARREEPAAIVARLRASVPAGFEVLGGAEVPLHGPSLMSEVVGAEYVLHAPVGRDDLADRVGRVLASERIVVARKSKSGPIEVDIRPLVLALAIDDAGGVRVSLRDRDGRPGKAKEVVAALGLDPATTRVRRLDVLVRGEDGPVSPSAGWAVG